MNTEPKYLLEVDLYDLKTDEIKAILVALLNQMDKDYFSILDGPKVEISANQVSAYNRLSNELMNRYLYSSL